jgi:tRNA (guanine37-N1)-methyltransferase
MRLDIVTIFPEFFSVLDVSLLGKAREADLVDARVHDLREWATVKADGTPDVHRTVDDAPFGGGAGMVMKPDVWGRALDDILTAGGVLIVPTPAGVPFTQALAAELATCEQLVFACGRYEGIDARVPEHYASTGFRVLEVSIGDYVLNGGEVATMAMIEAIARLVPGFMGNADSIVEESHADGLLEYPSYTRPASWRGLDVPPILLSGHHANVAAWRREQQLERTRQRRPDLLTDADAGDRGSGA